MYRCNRFHIFHRAISIHQQKCSCFMAKSALPVRKPKVINIFSLQCGNVENSCSLIPNLRCFMSSHLKLQKKHIYRSAGDEAPGEVRSNDSKCSCELDCFCFASRWGNYLTRKTASGNVFSCIACRNKMHISHCRGVRYEYVALCASEMLRITLR